jgi:putative iron-regulated protein
VEPRPEDPAAPSAVADGYLQLAFDLYGEALRSARVLARAIDALAEQPDAEQLAAARSAWVDAHRAYSLTEAFRFGNPNVDQWEGQVNAWPVDEGFLDYVSASYSFDLGNPHGREDRVASARELSAKSLRLSHELGGVEANVATGYHAIEFLLWGEDRNEGPEPGGQRPFTDFVAGDVCTHAPCERRVRYLRVTGSLLVADLQEMLEDWRPGYGAYWRAFRALDAPEQLRRILTGMGSLGWGELAGERIRAALLARSQEDEQSCFSDTTHIDLLQNARAIRAVYLGRVRSDEPQSSASSSGTRTRNRSASLSGLVHERDAALDALLLRQLDASVDAARAVAAAAEAGEPFDRQIRQDSPSDGRLLARLVETLKAQTGTIEKVQELLEHAP